MSIDVHKLPRRIPEGTRYVIEGEKVPGGTRITATYLILGNGQRIDLTSDSTRIVPCSCLDVAQPGQPRRSRAPQVRDRTPLLLSKSNRAAAAALRAAARAARRKGQLAPVPL